MMGGLICLAVGVDDDAWTVLPGQWRLVPLQACS